ncbi:Aldehyde/histidinol dehydrogenase [Entophlyctis helioformis]|nr:Aldehyde/histidinol dehydrogenase [Entophlyctis helioformis]
MTFVVVETPTASFTPLPEIPALVADAHKAFASGFTKDIAWRKAQLKALYEFTVKEETAIASALYKDLRKPYEDAMFFEIALVRNAIVEAVEHLDAWVEPQVVSSGSLAFALNRSEIRYHPYGVALIIGTWNYPVNLTLIPLVAAIAAGNAAVLKFSEVSPHTAATLFNLMPKYLDTRAIKYVYGAVPESTLLLEQKFNIIFYTGNSAVARVVMAAASKHLTPVVLELGGKSPVIVDKDIDVYTAAKRVLWGKTINAGQVCFLTCVAPDYVYVHKDVAEAFYKAIPLAIADLIGDPATSNVYTRIVNRNHFDRLKRIIDAQLQVPGSRLIAGGQTDADDLFIAPTVIAGIFGPVLPIIEYTDLDAVIKTIQSKGEPPLALYPFSRSSAVIEKIAGSVDAGNVMANDLIISLAIESLPFGGVGESGMGSYHGKHGFEAFSHKRATLLTPAGLEFVNMVRYQQPMYDRAGFAYKAVDALLFRKMPSGASLAVASVARKFGKLFGWLYAPGVLAAGVLLGVGLARRGYADRFARALADLF